MTFRHNGAVYRFEPDLSKVLGVRMEKVVEYHEAPWESAPRGEVGSCRLQGEKRDVLALLLGPRCLPRTRLPGYRLSVQGEMHHSSLMGAAIVQDGKVVGVVQAVPGDLWGFPLGDFLQFGNQGLRESLYLLHDFKNNPWPYSLVLKTYVNPESLFKPKIETLGGVIDNKRLAPVKEEFDDLRCLYLGGVVVNASCTVIALSAEPYLPFQVGASITQVNTLTRFSFDALLRQVETAPDLLMVAGDEAFFTQELPWVNIPSFATKVRKGAYMWGLAQGEDDEPLWSRAATPSPPSSPKREKKKEEREEEQEESAPPSPASRKSSCDYD